MRSIRTHGLVTAAALIMVLGSMAFAAQVFDDGVVDSGKDIHGLGHHQHGTNDGHLPASSANVDLIGQVRVTNAEGRVADVAVWNGFAYLAAFRQDACEGPESAGPDGGAYVVDIRDPAHPVEVGFIPIHQDSYAGEGVQALEVTTPRFNGDMLVINAESCGKNDKGGFTLYDVSDPLKPVKLVEHYGDFNVGADNPGRDANDIHSAFVWDAGDKAYVVVVDDLESADIDIFDITDPRKPVFVGEYDLDELFPQIIQLELGSFSSFFHDVVVREFDGRQIMLASYWDGGYVLLDVTDPANATYVADFDFTNPDPEALESGVGNVRPEGNAHEAEFTLDGEHIIVADEDFNPVSAVATNVDEGTQFFTTVGDETPELEDGQSIIGDTVFVGRACPGETVPAGDGTQIALIERGVCLFTEKVATVEAAGGYQAAIVFNRVGQDACSDLLNMAVAGGIPAFFVNRPTGFDLLNVAGYDEDQCRAGSSPALPAVGTVGDTVSLEGVFDGWGYVHLLHNDLDPDDANNKLDELDTYAIPESHDPAYTEGFGDLSVHEVATSHVDTDLAYYAYYSGGFRVTRIVNDEELVEVGHFIDEGGNNLWGVQVFEYQGRELVAASDRDFGLYIFEYTGD